MGDQYIHASKPLTATGQLQNLNNENLNRAAVQTLYIVVDDIAAETPASGSIVMRDGGATGKVLLNLPVTANSGPVDLELPQRGILFSTDVHVTLTGISSLVVFYEG